MNEKSSQPPSAGIDKIVASAKRLGIELNEAEALQWLAAVPVALQEEGITIDIKTGIFGHKITMLDFSDAELAHFRKIGVLVGFDDQPGVVETALALSGSAAQSKIQKYPGDADFFERVNIKANTKKEACHILGKIMRTKVRQALKGPTYQLIEVKMGSFSEDVVCRNHNLKKGSPISWKPQEVLDGRLEVKNVSGEPLVIDWESAEQDPGWCKLDWVVAHPVYKHLINASNMLDVTWEAPDGSITPLDGYLDPYFQEVYLEAESIPLFAKLAKHVSSDALNDYVEALSKEVKKYLTRSLNYGKAAKRMYNIFRLTGRYEIAAYVRELFDEPTTVLYQVWSLIRTIDDCFQPETNITREQMLDHFDDLITMVVRELEGEEEVEIVRILLRLRDFISREKPGEGLSPQSEAARAEVINIVNNFFYEKLTAVPEIKQYMQKVVES